LTRRRVIALLSFIALAFLALAGGLVIYINSPSFEREARGYIVRQIERQTGAEVTLDEFNWSLRRQRVHLGGLILRGLEPRNGPPLASLPTIDVGINFRSLFQKKLDLFELTLSKPEFHIFIDERGKTNFPTPPERGPRGSFDFEVAIDNFRFIEGAAFLNERQISIDFVLANLAAELSYRSTTSVLTSHLRYDGQYIRQDNPTIPYTFDADMDYTVGTLIAHRINLQTGKSLLKLQGKINDLLKKTINGKLDYTGTVEVPFLNYFFQKEKFAGTADVAGFLEFSGGYFFSKGTTTSESITFNEWVTKEFRSDYSYYFPEKRAAFHNMRTNIFGGTAAGSAAIENIPGEARIILDVGYSGVDAAALANSYPWDPKYRIYSNVTGTLNGWFEGRMERYLFAGNANFKAYTPPSVADVVPLPIDGTTGYQITPGLARVSNGDLRFGSTHVKADGLIAEKNTDLKVVLDSTDLRDGYFIYDDANGSGTFDGTLTGPIKTPVFKGNFTLKNHSYHKKGTIEDAVGLVRLDTLTEMADLDRVHLRQGRSEIVVTGTTALAGSPADLEIQAVRVFGEDLRAFVDRKIGGTIAGRMRLTSFDPMKVEGDLRATNLVIDDRDVGNASGHLRYFDPVIELGSLQITRNGSSLAGNVTYNPTSEVVKFAVRVSSVDFDSIKWIGLPDALKGTIRQADLQGDGTLKQPNVKGTGVIENLAFKSEVFPLVRVNVTSSGSDVNASIEAARNLNLDVKVNAAAAGYPFTANAKFTQYGLEQIAGLAQGTMKATGTAVLTGLLNDPSKLRGEGQIETAEGVLRGYNIHISKPFTFDFNPERLMVSNIILTGEGTAATIGGTIGLTDRTPLNLEIDGLVDLKLLSAATTQYETAGTVNVNGRIRGTAQNPDLSGHAEVSRASLSKPGFFTSLNNVNGELFFEGNRVRLDNMTGQMGGGTVQLQGNLVLQQAQIEGMNVRIETNNVRIRYPEGLRTVINGTLVLRGTSTAPILEGDLEIQRMEYRSSFENFLTMVTGPTTIQGPSQLDQLRLSLHIEGGRNITIQNELADVEARVDIDITGTAGHPALTGHVEASGGTMTFQGKKYTITRGNVDFVNPLRIEPVVDLQAETDIRDYRVILAVTGRGDQIRLNMRSDPPLPQIDIVNLIAGGKTRQELLESGTTRTPVSEEQLFKGSAASILSGLLQERIGGGAINRLGIGNIRVGPDPSLLAARNQAAIRLTYEYQVTKDLSVTYSRDLTQTNQVDLTDIIQIEYFVSKSVSVIASRDETDAKSLDVRFKKRLK
jgi:translocation and assembly module TamB